MRIRRCRRRSGKPRMPHTGLRYTRNPRPDLQVGRVGATRMATNVVMPQMGESIAEGTIVRWIKKVGDNVDRDEPLFEISTDKVDAEIPSPGAGVLTEIKVKEGETVPVNSVVAVIGGISLGAPREAPTPTTSEMPEAVVGQPEAAVASAAPADAATVDRHHRSSPLVRRIAKEHNVDIRQIN